MGTTGCTFKLKHRKENMPNGMSEDSVKEKYGGIIQHEIVGLLLPFNRNTPQYVQTVNRNL